MDIGVQEMRRWQRTLMVMTVRVVFVVSLLVTGVAVLGGAVTLVALGSRWTFTAEILRVFLWLFLLGLLGWAITVTEADGTVVSRVFLTFAISAELAAGASGMALSIAVNDQALRHHGYRLPNSPSLIAAIVAGGVAITCALVAAVCYAMIEPPHWGRRRRAPARRWWRPPHRRLSVLLVCWRRGLERVGEYAPVGR